MQAIEKTLSLIERLRKGGFTVNTLDIGGGFAADYESGKSPDAGKYAAAIVPLLKGRGLAIILEPGRQIAANSGVLLASVLYIKQGGERNFVIVDAAMTDLIRPALYEAQHFIWPAKLAAGATAPERRIDLAAPGGVKVTWSEACANRAISLPRTACCRPWLAAICWPCSRQARMGLSCPASTTAGRERPRCWWTVASGGSYVGGKHTRI